MDFGGFSLDRLLLIGLVAVILIGPERLPRYAEGLARLVRKASEYARDTKDRMREEIGPEIDEVDWRKLDPRQYDPRRIIRDALLDDAPVAAAGGAAAVIAEPAVGAAAASAAPVRMQIQRAEFTVDNPPPFDADAT